MIKLIITTCLVVNTYICLPPVEVIPQEGSITSITHCLMGGAIANLERGPEWYSKITCVMVEQDFNAWMEDYIRSTHKPVSPWK